MNLDHHSARWSLFERGTDFQRIHISHLFRWSHVTKSLYKRRHPHVCRVLDAGCGIDMSLARFMGPYMVLPEAYCAVDINPLELPKDLGGRCETTVILGQTMISDLTLEAVTFRPNIIVCLEVLEHMDLDQARKSLVALRSLATDDCTALFSTPNWRPGLKPLDDHINEFTYRAFGALLEDTGWMINEVWGCYGNQEAYYGVMTEGERDVWDRLKAYHHHETMSMLMAPLFPEVSRDCLWSCSPDNVLSDRRFPHLEELPRPWGSAG